MWVGMDACVCAYIHLACSHIHIKPIACSFVCVCVFVCVRESVCVCAVCVCVWMGVGVGVWMGVSVFMRVLFVLLCGSACYC